MISKTNRNVARKKRHMRVRNKICGTAQRPRLNVYRSLKQIYAQLIDDNTGVTLVSASSLEKELKNKLEKGHNLEAAGVVGEILAKRALEKDIKEAIFDRGGYKYHGRVKALADAAREAGLSF